MSKQDDRNHLFEMMEKYGGPSAVLLMLADVLSDNGQPDNAVIVQEASAQLNDEEDDSEE